MTINDDPHDHSHRAPDEDGWVTPSLLARLRAGDPGAQHVLYNGYFRMVRSYLGVTLGAGHQAEDLAQETFIRALASLPHYRSEGRPLRAWLVRIARNLALDQLKAARRRDNTEDQFAARTWQRELQNAADPFNRVIGRQMLLHLRELPQDHREVLFLYYALDWPFKDIAAVLGRSEDAAKQLKHRALRSLQRTVGATAEQGFGRRSFACRRLPATAPVLLARRHALAVAY